MGKCLCGCGQYPKSGNKYLKGHNRRQRVIVACANCRIPVVTSPALAMRSFRKYCSAACASVGKRAKFFETRPQHWKRYARSVYGDQCVICGFNAVTDVHHVVPRAAGGGNEIENLVVVCPNHHRMAHAGMITARQLIRAAARRRKVFSKAGQ